MSWPDPDTDALQSGAGNIVQVCQEAVPQRSPASGSLVMWSLPELTWVNPNSVKSHSDCQSSGEGGGWEAEGPAFPAVWSTWVGVPPSKA